MNEYSNGYPTGVCNPYDGILKILDNGNPENVGDDSQTTPSTRDSGMSAERFNDLLDELDGRSLQTLKEKNAKYSSDGDCLHNFRSGAEILGGTPAQACWGYLTKHLVALRDMVERNDFSDKDDFLEKCQDTINYIRFLWCIGNDQTDNTDKENI